MKRKVARVGPSTLMISLPSKWVKQHHIQKGLELDLEEKEELLIIHPSDSPVTQQAEIRFEKKDQFLKRYLRSLYHRGFTEIKIVCEEGIDIDKIEEKLDDYIGFEIIEQGKNYCIIRNVADTIESELGNVLRKLFLMNGSMGEGSLEHIQNGNFTKLVGIAAIERTNNKLINLSYRIINKSGKSANEHTINLCNILMCLENMADSYKEICIFLKDKKPGIGKNVIEFYKAVSSHYQDCSHIYYKFDKSRIVEIREKRLELIDKGNKLLQTARMEEAVVMHHLLSILNQMKDIELSFDVSGA